ncbi:MAG: class I SAM-dependent methyltransferase [Pseudohongiellaceae bacterium]
MRYRVHGDFDSDSFLTTGQAVFQDLQNLVSIYDQPPCRQLRVLDFGCGCARTLRHRIAKHNNWSITGVDTDIETIEWNRRVFPNLASWIYGVKAPPLTIPAQSFDLIVAVSVFTHLDENLQDQWLRELRRLLSPGGLIIISIHGEFIWSKNADWCPQLKKYGFLYAKTNLGIRNFSAMPAYYQTALHSKSYVLKHWSSQFRILSYRERGMNNYQDVVVMKKNQHYPAF